MIWWQRGNKGAATNGKQQSINAQHAQRRTSNNGRMRWRTTGQLRRCGGWSNGQATMVGGRGATMVLLTTTNKQQSTIERRQRQRTTMADERWGVVAEVENPLLYSGEGETALQ
jgi:hypothetical protein